MSDRNCKDCKYNKVVNGEEGCSRWQCEYEPKDMEDRAMTIKEAIHFAECLKNHWTLNLNNLEDFYDMAIKALQEQDQDGCAGCKYIEKDMYEMPCLVCSKSHQNMWKGESHEQGRG